MNKGYKLFAAFLIALTLVGVTANASRRAAILTLAQGVAVNDTVKAADNVAGGDTAKAKTAGSEADIPETSIIDEVIWVVGDEPILKSDVEMMRLQGEAEGMTWHGNPDCSIPEQLALQKLFLHQAAIDSIEVTESEVTAGVDRQIDSWIQYAGSKEKLEEYRKMSLAQIRQQLRDDSRNQYLIERMKDKLVEDVKVTPADVRRYFSKLPEDSVPFVPTEVEVEIITKQPKPTQEEINHVKDELREYTERVNKGETTFATLARLYSEDPGSARQGGELGYTGRGYLDPAFASVAFNLTDPRKISKIVESEYGFHIIQLIDKRGDKVNVRHILRKPRIETAAVEASRLRLDSIADDIRAGKVPFEEAATFLSDDKDTRNNHGLMSSASQSGITSRFQMKDLPTEVARQVENMKVGDISKAFEMVGRNGKVQCAIIKLKSRTDGHRATITEDYQVMKNVVLATERQKVLHDWVVDKIKKTYVRMNDRYKGCDYEYEGWVK